MITFLLAVIAFGSTLSAVQLVRDELEGLKWKKQAKEDMRKARQEWEERI